MPCNLQNAPTCIILIREPVRFKFALFYFDFISIFQNVAEHLDIVEIVLTILWNDEITIKLNTCLLINYSAEYLGHNVRLIELKFMPKKIEAVKIMDRRITILSCIIKRQPNFRKGLHRIHSEQTIS